MTKRGVLSNGRGAAHAASQARPDDARIPTVRQLTIEISAGDAFPLFFIQTRFVSCSMILKKNGRGVGGLRGIDRVKEKSRTSCFIGEK